MAKVDLSEFDDLLSDFGNANFDCGAFDADGDRTGYHALSEIAGAARQAVIDWVRKKLEEKE